MIMSKNEKEQKFISVYQAHIDEVYRYVFLRTGLDTALAEDISQDIFLDVFKGLNEFKGLCSERTWVFRIAKNKLYDFYRNQYRQKIEIVEIDYQLAEQLSDPKQNIEQVMETAFASECVISCLNSLPQQYKITLLLKYIDGKSIKQIAEIANKSPKATESMLQRAKNAFMKQYQSFEAKEGF